MIHQPSGGFQGQVSDIEIHANEVIKLKKQLNELLAFHTGKSMNQVEKDSDRDNFMDPNTALDYGIIDSILTKRK
jgi:ATP-dependent Clp protease protease subunit